MINKGFHLIPLAELSPIRVHNRGENEARIDSDDVCAPSAHSLINKRSTCYGDKAMQQKIDRFFIFAMGAVVGYLTSMVLYPVIIWVLEGPLQ